MKHDMMGCHWH